MYRSTDAGASWLRINDDAYQFGGPGNGEFVMGDMNVEGLVCMSTVGRGIVSKNGNVLLSIPLRGDGTIDADERKILETLGEWMGRNGEAINGTRRGAPSAKGRRRSAAACSATDKSRPSLPKTSALRPRPARCKPSGLAWPASGVVRIAALAQDSALAPGAIERVEAVGSTDSLPFKRTPQGLEVRLPESLAGTPAIALKIRGNGLT